MGSECVGLVFEKPIKKKRALPKEADWGDRLLYWIMPPGNEEALSRELGVASLTSFLNAPSQSEGWFDATVGLETTRALLKLANDSPEKVQGPAQWGAYAAENFLPDLESLEQALKVAAEEGTRFRLQVV